MARISSDYETFGDGLLSICETDERNITGTKMEHIRYGNKTVGVQRFWKAKTVGNKVDKLISVPLEVLQLDQILVNDIAILETEPGSPGQYQILQIQPKYDSRPPALYLSLERLIHPYKDERTENGN